MKCATGVILGLFVCAVAGAAAATPTTVPVRQIKYPLKTARTLHTSEQIATARANIAKYPAAKAIADAIIEDADEWVNWKDEDLRFLLTSPDVPRAFAVSASGCPLCGGKMKQSNGDYSWIIDPKQPFKIKCPVDGSVFPSNDYESYYRSGFKEKKDWDGKYVDDGWGWTDPKTGEKFWFVAYYNHWMWHNHLVPGLANLGNAYLLTGDKKYAHKAAVMLQRIAEVYPGMDHTKQSRYGTMMAARGINYPGKVVNNIWECGLAQSVCDAYDAVWETIDSDAELQSETHKTGEQIRSFIEANFLEDAIDAYFQGKIRGNFGMHQACLIHLALVRQTGESDKWFDQIMNVSSSSYQMLGLNYALYDLIYRDGFPMESAPGYNIIWANKISEIGELLGRGGRDVFANARVKRLYNAVLDQINAGTFTPAWGDSGYATGSLVGKDPEMFQTAWRHYHDPRYAAWLAQMGASGENSFKTFDSLFEPPIDVPADAKLPPAKPRLLDGVGLAILNNPADDISMTINYGQHHGHGHFDRLGFELFANGQPIVPDLGYPDAMNDFVPGIFTWSKNTIAHNTVVVDAQRQQGVGPGEVKFFGDCDFARVIDVEAKEAYPQCSHYRRAIIMVDCGQNQSYFIDIFTVVGGKQHDYSLHGPPGEFETIVGEWSDRAKGTLAGENVEIGQIYDNRAMGAKGYSGGYGSYTGSGFQHLFNVRTLKVNDYCVAQWKHAADPHAMVRIHVLDQPEQKLMLCDAHQSPEKYPRILKYLIARRRSSDGKPLESRFISVIEPFKDRPFITQVVRAPSERSDIVSLEVHREGRLVDRILYNPAGWEMKNAPPAVAKRAEVSVIQSRTNGAPAAFFVSTRNDYFLVLRGSVSEVMPTTGKIRVAINTRLGNFDEDTLVGRVIHFDNNWHRTAHTITSARREADNTLLLTLRDDFVVGFAELDGVEPRRLHTSTALPLSPCYRGTTLSDELFRLSANVVEVTGGNIRLLNDLPKEHPLRPGSRVWLLDVGVGDRAEIPCVYSTP